MQPYGVLSDSHCHDWSAFATENDDLINTRLAVILDEIERCAAEVHKVGGDTVYHAGDLFHVRGRIAPSVLNPTRDRFEHIYRTYGVKFRLLPGNHDLEHKHSNRVGNAIEAMRSQWVEVGHDTQVFPEHNVLMVPWVEGVADLKKRLELERDNLLTQGEDPANYNLIIHAPIDGVIEGLPDHGLTGEWLAALGFKRVFSGHYHNHKEIAPGKVWSVGATTHQTWGDTGSKAGFLIVSTEDVKWHCSRAPHFVDIEAGMDPSEVALRCDGNYIRVRVMNAKPSEVSAIRDGLMKHGALGVNVNVVKVPTTGRAVTSTIKAGASVEVQVTDYIKANSLEHTELVQQAAIAVLAEAV